MEKDIQAKQPKPRIKIKRKSILVFASFGILGLVYIPAPKPRPDKDFVSRVYARKTGEQRWYASEKRKTEIFAEIRKIRQQIRLQAKSYSNRDKRRDIIYLSIKL